MKVSVLIAKISFSLSLIALADIVLQFISSKDGYLVSRILGTLATTLLFIGLYALVRYKKQLKLVAIVLTTGLTLLASLLVYRWGLLIPTGILLFGLSIVMGSIVVSARFSLYVAGLITLITAGLQFAQSRGSWQPDLIWMKSRSTAADIIGFTAIFFTIALVTWLFNRQMELALKRAWRSEKALKRQKMLLEIKVEQRAKQLEASQLEKMQ